MQYLTYEEYKKIGGVLEETAFNRNIIRACGEIDARTKKRIRNMISVPDEIKALCRDLVEHFAENSVSGKAVSSKSQSAGAVSESESYVIKSKDEMATDVDDMFYSYLSSLNDDNGTPLLYRGCNI